MQHFVKSYLFFSESLSEVERNVINIGKFLEVLMQKVLKKYKQSSSSPFT